MTDDTISRAAALDALGERPTVWTDDDDYALGERNQYDMDRLAIETVPSAQPVNIAKLQSNCNQVASDCASDCISRQAAINICDDAIDLWNGRLGTGALVAVRDAIMALPSAQPDVSDTNQSRGEVTVYANR